MSEPYQYIFGPLVNVGLAEERCELGTASVRKMEGAALEKLWRWMQDQNTDAARHWVHDKAPSEAAFVVKDHRIDEVCRKIESSSLDEKLGVGEIYDVELKGSSSFDRDVLWRERVALNLSFDVEIGTPVVFYSDDFPEMTEGRGGQLWEGPDIGEDWEWMIPGRGQQINESSASAISVMLHQLLGEELDKHPWLRRALDAYDKASRLSRESEDQWLDYWKAIEALLTVGAAAGDKLARRVAVLVGTTEKERNQIYTQVDNMYGVRSKNLHRAQPIGNAAEALRELRRYARRSILMTLDVSRSVNSNRGWESWCETLLQPGHKDLSEEIRHIRSRWSAVW